jgi:hypothetical protein
VSWCEDENESVLFTSDDRIIWAGHTTQTFPSISCTYNIHHLPQRDGPAMKPCFHPRVKLFSGFIHCPGVIKTTTFRKFVLFPSSVERRKTPTLPGPLFELV